LTVYDARGAEIFPGDIAIYVSGGRYTSRHVVRVAETRAQVRIDRIDNLGRQPYDEHQEALNWGRPQWVGGGSLFVVTGLPYVEHRLNRKAGT